MHTPVHSNYGFNDPIPTSTSSPQDVQEQSAGIQAPQYPAPASPTFSSIAERQRMFMDDAMIAEQGAQERQDKVLAAGGKAFVGYDKMLRGFMEAKYAKPELKFWDYAQNPSTSAAYRLQGVKKITADVEAGVDIKDIPGMTFGSRQKAGLKAIFEKGASPAAPTTGSGAGIDPTALPSKGSLAAAQRDIESIGSLPTSSQEAAGRELESIKRDEKIFAGETDILKQLKGLKTTTKVSPGAMEKYRPAGSAAPDMSKPIYDDTGRKVFGGTFDELEYAEADFYKARDEAKEATESASELITSLQEGNMPIWGRIWGEGKDPVEAFHEKAAAEDLALENKFKAEDAASRVRSSKFIATGKKLHDEGGNYIGDVGEAGGKPIYENIKNLPGGKGLVDYQQIYKFTNPEGASSYYRMAGKNTAKPIKNPSKFISTAGNNFDPKRMALDNMTKVDIDSGAIEAAGGEYEFFKSKEFKKAYPMPEAAGEAAGEAAKGGLKSTFGKVAGGIGAGVSIASGAERLKSKDQATQLGGAMQVAGGAAQAVALTNFWNPAGWAAAIPAALSIGGGLMGGDRSAIGRTPIGKSLRRLNIS